MATIGLLCVLFYLAAAAVLLSRREATRPLRETALIAAVVWAVWLVLGTELLSLAGALRWWPVLLWWLVPTAGLVIVAGRDRRWLERLKSERASLARPDWLTCGFLLALGAILLVTLVIAAVTPPNNWDSQTYHLPRQVQWMQQGSVEHFATPDLRQVVMPPLAEFAGLHLMILTRGDGWLNLIQWFALAMTALTVSLIARELNAGARGQSLAGLLVVTYPLAAMQAMNTKNDLVVSLWACSMAYFALQVWTRRRCPPGHTALIGATLGLMVLTKGTGFIVGLPISAGAAVAILSVQRWRGLLTGATIGAIALAINGPHFARNIQDFGSPMGPSAMEGGFALANETHSPAAMTSNVVRNLALHAGTPWDSVNAGTMRAMERLHDALGVGISDERTSYLGLTFDIFWRPYSESQAPGPLHVLLGVALLPAALASRRRLLIMAALVPVTAFVLFCFVLKWQPWHARLHITLVCLAAPALAVLLERPLRGSVGAVVAMLAATQVAPSILWNQHKPLLGRPSIFTASRDENMFRIRPTLLEPFQETVQFCLELQPDRLTLLRVSDQWMYPFQRALLEGLETPPLFDWHVPHPSQRREYELDPPVAILHTRGEPLLIQTYDASYIPVFASPPYAIYLREELALQRDLGLAISDFAGWRKSEGLDRIEGPFPDRDLPQVRWGLGPETTLRFLSEGEPTSLVLDGRSRDSGQTLEVRLNGKVVATHAFSNPPSFEHVRVPLMPRPGMNQLVIRYGSWDQEARRPTTVLYRRLQIVPQSLLEHADRAGSEN